MTLDELINEIKDLHWEREWKALRCENGKCPILAVYTKRFPAKSLDNSRWEFAAMELGLSHTLAAMIVAASDYSRESLVPEELEIRNKLDKLLGAGNESARTQVKET